MASRNVFRPPVMKQERSAMTSSQATRESNAAGTTAASQQHQQHVSSPLSECPVCMEPYEVGDGGEGGMTVVSNETSAGNAPVDDQVLHGSKDSIESAVTMTVRLPYLLHCGHSFCHQCLEHCAAAERQKATSASSSSLRSSLFGSLLSPFTSSSASSSSWPSAMQRRSPLGWARDSSSMAASASGIVTSPRSQQQRVSVPCPICRVHTAYDPSKGPVGGLPKNYELISAIRIIQSLLECKLSSDRVETKCGAEGGKKRKARSLSQDLGTSDDDESDGYYDAERTHRKAKRLSKDEKEGSAKRMKLRSETSPETGRKVNPKSRAWGTLIIADKKESKATEEGTARRAGRSRSASLVLTSSEDDSLLSTTKSASPTSIPRSRSSPLRSEDFLRNLDISPRADLEVPVDESLSKASSTTTTTATQNSSTAVDDSFLPTAPPAYLFNDSDEASITLPGDETSFTVQCPQSPSFTGDSDLVPSAPPLPFPSHLFHYPSSPFHTSSPSSSFELPSINDELAASDVSQPDEPVPELSNETASHADQQQGEMKWIEAADKCKRCERTFGLLVRSRRCHHCGGLFCYRCCWQFSDMPTSFGYRRKQRTCIPCSQALQSISESSDMDLDQQASEASSEVVQDWPSFELDTKLAAIYDISCKTVNVGVDAIALAKGEGGSSVAESTLIWGRCIGAMVALPLFVVGTSTMLMAAGGYHAWHFLAKKRRQWEDEVKLRQEEERLTRTRLDSSSAAASTENRSTTPFTP